MRYWIDIILFIILTSTVSWAFHHYSNNSWLTVTKLGISMMSVFMTFVVFMRGFEVYEETQKINSKDNVNKNFYNLLSIFEKKQASIFEADLSNDCNITKFYSAYDNVIKSIFKSSNLTESKFDKYNQQLNEIIREDKTHLFPYFSALKNIVNYLDKSFDEKIINISEYKTYMLILTGQISDREMMFILQYALYMREGIDFGLTMYCSGLTGYFHESDTRDYTIHTAPFEGYFKTKASVKFVARRKKALQNSLKNNDISKKMFLNIFFDIDEEKSKIILDRIKNEV